ncbi:MAG TPA: hypothetical protein VLN59_15185, partial [Burkholderiales bacterium]|nr:hypothetical protein [Burkholderiales bacterium]
MKQLLARFIVLLLTVCAYGVAWADDDGAVRRFVTLPDGVQFPEGIAANPANEDIFVATFDTRGTNANNKLLRYDRRGHLLAQRNFGATPLLGLVFDPVQRK